MRIDEVQIGQSAMKNITVSIDVAKLQRAMLGVFKWRLHLACTLLKLVGRTLRCNIEIKQ